MIALNGMNEDELLDIIREIINIGMGEAANSMSKLVNSRVIIKVPDVQIMSQTELYDYIQKQLSTLGVYMSQSFSGQSNGKTILFYTKDCSISLLNAIYKKPMMTSSLSESGIAALNEIGNMVMGSCIAEIGNLMDTQIHFDIPEISVDVSQNYFQNMLKELGDSGKAIVVKNEIKIKENDIRGYLFVLLSFEDFNLFIEKIWGKMGTHA